MAPGIYEYYSQNYPEAINMMNVLAKKTLTDGFLSSNMSMYLTLFGEIPAFDFNSFVLDTQYRIDFPLLMLYPNRHKPKHPLVKSHQQGRLIEFMKVSYPPVR